MAGDEAGRGAQRGLPAGAGGALRPLVSKRRPATNMKMWVPLA